MTSLLPSELLIKLVKSNKDKRKRVKKEVKSDQDKIYYK